MEEDLRQRVKTLYHWFFKPGDQGNWSPQFLELKRTKKNFRILEKQQKHHLNDPERPKNDFSHVWNPWVLLTGPFRMDLPSFRSIGVRQLFDLRFSALIQQNVFFVLHDKIKFSDYSNSTSPILKGYIKFSE